MERISSLAPPPSLRSCFHVRWCCPVHGYFDTETIDLIYAQCPECSEDAGMVDQCRGMTSKHLPFVSRPRLQTDPEPAKWQVNNSHGITGRLRANPKSIRNGRSTGRPRKYPNVA